ncbi:Bromodomain-containing protein [Zychaea mexicana]|uniref:Bromodomain-containing protein n=1 Tax=Zychaea mexicana TaxID=64656 RepID=UPI0022FF24C0|nr:Bromodomain-containing protein [Zychaea mexicana]KAI9497250.1 Bromodomain-containing protein [Zychaea mexicana]
MLALNTSDFLPPSPQSMETDNTRPTMSPASKRFCTQVLSKLFKSRHSLAFRIPVDPVALNCPDYFNIVKHPMDLSTVQKKLDNDEYESVDAFVDDIRLIFDNCHKYNNPADPVAVEGRKMEAAFNDLLEKRPSTTYPGVEPTEIMPEDQQKRCEGALKEMKRKKHGNYNWLFINPVDAVAWGATDYYDIIKKPMDLSKIQTNLDEYQYANEEEFAADVRLMFQNCYTYNNPQHPVYNQGKTLEKVFDTYWAKEHSSSSSKAKNSKKSSSSTKSKHVAKLPEKVKEEDAAVSQKRTSDHLDSRDDSSNKKKSDPPNLLRIKLSHTNKDITESNDVGKQNEEQVSPHTPSSSSSLAFSSTPALSSHTRPLAISKEPPPSSSSQPKSLALSATKPAAATTKHSSASAHPPSYLSTQRRPSDDNNRVISIPDARKRESNEASKYPADKYPAGKHPAGKHPASKHPAAKHPPGKHPAGKHPKQASQQQTTPVSPPPPPARMLDFDSLLDKISNENRLREQERKDQLRANEEKQRTAKQLEMRRLQEEERAQKEWQERTTRQKKLDRQRREAELVSTRKTLGFQGILFELTPQCFFFRWCGGTLSICFFFVVQNATTIDISKHKLTFNAFEKQLSVDQDWRDLLRWHRETVDYRHIPRPGFMKRRPDKTVAEVKASLLNRALRCRSQLDGAQERDEEGEQDMDVE